MNYSLLATIFIAEIFSLILIIRLWRSNEHTGYKIIGALIGLIPILGFFLILFIFSPQPQTKDLQNRGPRGDYTHSWTSFRKKFWEDAIKEKEAEIKKHEDKNK